MDVHNVTTQHAGTSPIPGVVFTGDILLIIIYLISTLIGLPGNLLAVAYFTRPALKRDLSSALYIAVSIIDVAICILQLPVLVSLIMQRAPVLFGRQLFCIIWRLLYKTLQRLSVFLVLLLSVSRTISLVRPLPTVRKRVVLGILYGYLCYMVVEMAAVSSHETWYYDRAGVYCFEFGNSLPYSTINYCLYTLTLGLPALIIFVSFVVSVVTIKRSISSSLGLCEGAGRSSGGNPLKKHASTTIIIFTFTYIVCNIPHFINMTLWIVVKISDTGYPGPLYKPLFMYWWSWNISEILSVVLNSACNPIIYYFRISQYREWVMGRPILKKICVFR